MKTITLLFLLVFSWMDTTIYAQEPISGVELHVSINHPLGKTRTFYGGGFGANLVFRDERTFSFKTGFEANFFHTWNERVYAGHMASSSNVHYHLWNLSIPVMFRVNAGKRIKFFAEAGAYLGIPIAGTMTSRYVTYSTSPTDPGTDGIRTEKFGGYFSLSPAVSAGGIFPVSQRVDLILKPEFLFQKNFDASDEPFGDDFNAKFYYFRLCVGIHLKLNRETE